MANLFGVVDTSSPGGLKEFLFAKQETQQTANLGAGDHVKFDTVIASRGKAIALDVATTYVNTANTASIGRVTLKANRTYRLRALISYILSSGATGLLVAQFYDATASAVIPGTQATIVVATGAAHDNGGGGQAEAIFTPTVNTLVELRLITATAVTQIGITTVRTSSLFVESDV